MNYKITGTTLPLLEVTLRKAESIYAQSGSLLMLGDGVAFQTELVGGALQGLRRLAGGEHFYICKYVSEVDDGKVALSDPTIGMIIPLHITEETPMLCDRGAFLCCESSVKFDIAFMKRIRDVLFSGEGVVLQKLSGNGTALLHCWGEVVEYNLELGEVIRVSSGNVVAFSTTVKLQTRIMNGGKNILFGGEGVFITELTGPGKVIVQSADKNELMHMIHAM
jgi:uncharacterized protein (TIGR00266 family)